ncbi:MAG: DUF3473 domain-containing protein, partial [Gammaproteobacteria bacterium]
MSVDVEDYFQVSAFEGHVDRNDWDRIPCRVERNVDRILELFDRAGIQATFFILGWIAQRYPAMVQRIAGEGHEIASHGWDHTRATTQAPDAFREDIRRTRGLLEEISGQPVIGYRAASYSIGEHNLWAHEILAEEGYRYSSSIVPVRHDLYGMPNAPRFPFEVADGRLLEIPITTVPVAGRNINCGGGGWFRLFPYAFTRRALRRVTQEERQAAVFYFHPWEIDPGQPRQPDLPLKTRVRHYLNLERMEAR